MAVNTNNAATDSGANRQKANAGGTEDMLFPKLTSNDAYAPRKGILSKLAEYGNSVDANSGYYTDPLTSANAAAGGKGTTPVQRTTGLEGLDAVTSAAPSTGDGGNPSNNPSNDPSTNPSSNPSNNNPSNNSYGGGDGGGGDGSGGSSGGNGTGYSDATLLSQLLRQAGVGTDVQPYELPTIDGPNPERLEHVDTSNLRAILQQIVDAQKQQSQNQIDYGVEQGVNELNRAMEDAAAQYQTQRNQATADEMRALDNQALYAEARGDRGGIGESQYASIQAAAAQNRRAVNDAQVKLGTDTARQISDLRSKGEFEKADQLLSITQSYLSQLMGLEQWALEANLGVDEFNSRLQQWVDEYNLNVQQYLSDLDLSAAQLTGMFSNGTRTLAAQNQLTESLANSGSALLAAGVLPSKQQLEAMGMTEVQAKAYIKKTAE